MLDDHSEEVQLQKYRKLVLSTSIPLKFHQDLIILKISTLPIYVLQDELSEPMSALAWSTPIFNNSF